MRAKPLIRLVLCGLVAGMIWHVVSVLLLLALAPDLMPSLRSAAPYGALSGFFFYAIDLAMGMWAIWLYSAIAPRYGDGPRTAAIAGFSWWLIKTLQSSKLLGLGFVHLGASMLPLGAATLLAAVVATAVGAWMYHRLPDP